MPKNLIQLNKYLGAVSPVKPKPLGLLKHVDRQIVLLSLEGFSSQEIVDQIKVSPARVRRVLSSEACQQVQEDFLSFKDREFQMLYQLSISAVRDALRSEDIEVRLKAADKFFKAQGKYDRGQTSAHDTAEDVIRRIMEVEDFDSGRRVKITEERRGSSLNGPQLTAQNSNSKG